MNNTDSNKIFINKSKKLSGFTLVEIIVIITILAILTFISINVLKNFRDHEALTKSASLIVETLRQAKNLTLNSKDSYEYGVHFNTNDMVLFRGSTYPIGSSTNITYDFNSSVVVSNTTLNGGGSDIIFKKLSGETNNNGTITLTSELSKTSQVITVYKTGLVE